MKKLKKWQIVLIVILALGVIGALAGRGKEKRRAGSRENRQQKERRQKEGAERENLRYQGHAEGRRCGIHSERH